MPADPTSSAARVHDRRWWTLGVLCLSLLIIFIGNSSLNVTLPTLSRDLHATESQLQWVVAAYSLVFAGLLFTSGALGDRFGRKGALQFGLLVFLAGAGLATLSNDMWQLIACRSVMGVGAAFIMPSTLSILINVFPPHERTKAIAIWASFTGAAGGFGPLVSGLLLKHFWWGSVFFINVPIVVVALVAGALLVPSSRDPEEAPLDPVGAVLSTVGIVALVFGLIEAPEKGWTSATVLVAFAVSAVVLGAFVLWERRVAEPMLDVRYFRNAAFSTGTVGMVLIFMSMYGLLFLLTQYLQLVLGYSALSAAVHLLPIAMLLLAVSPFTPRFSAVLGANRAVALGMTLAAAGLLVFRLTGVSTSYAYVAVGLGLFTLGMGMTMSPMTAAIMTAVPPRRAGAGSAMNDATRELGAALGIAILGSVAASHYSHLVRGTIATLAPSDRTTASSSLAGALRVADTLPGDAGPHLRHVAQTSFVASLHLSTTVGAVLALVATVLVLRYLPRTLSHAGPTHGPVESLEATAELALGGGYPVTADELDHDDELLHGHQGASRPRST